MGYVDQRLSGFEHMTVLAAAIALAIGYFCGAVPFGLVITRLAGTQDRRRLRERRAWVDLFIFETGPGGGSRSRRLFG